MQRPIILVPAILLVAILAGGCWKTGDLQALQKATVTTKEITRGQTLTEFHYQMDFDELDLTPEEHRKLETYRKLKGTVTERFDRQKGLSYVNAHLDLGGMGFDLKVYTDANRTILLLPTFTKFLVIQRENLEQRLPEESPGIKATNWAKQLADLWNGLLKAENVRRTGAQPVSTPEGDIKVTGYEVVLKDTEIRKLARESVRVILSDPEIKEQIINNWLKYVRKEDLQDEDIDNRLAVIMEQALKGIDQTRFKDFHYTGAADRDSHLVLETIHVRTATGTEKGPTVTADLNIKTQRWSIGRQMSFDMPEITPENSFVLEELEANMPKVFESIFEEMQR
ncbi:hypothetical protein [Desulfoscipio gibsoniae]